MPFFYKACKPEGIFFPLDHLSWRFFGHHFVEEVAFLQRAHIDHTAELGHWSLQKRKHQTSIQMGREETHSKREQSSNRDIHRLVKCDNHYNKEIKSLSGL